MVADPHPQSTEITQLDGQALRRVGDSGRKRWLTLTLTV
jgi:hypothetical protein